MSNTMNTRPTSQVASKPRPAASVTLPVAAQARVNTLQTLRGETGGATNNRSGFLPLGLRDAVFDAEQRQAAALSFGRTAAFPERPTRHVPVDTVTTRSLIHADDGIVVPLPVEVAGVSQSAKFKGFHKKHCPDPVEVQREGRQLAADARVQATLAVRSALLIKHHGRDPILGKLAAHPALQEDTQHFTDTRVLQPRATRHLDEDTALPLSFGEGRSRMREPPHRFYAVSEGVGGSPVAMHARSGTTVAPSSPTDWASTVPSPRAAQGGLTHTTTEQLSVTGRGASPLKTAPISFAAATSSGLLPDVAGRVPRSASVAGTLRWVGGELGGAAAAVPPSTAAATSASPTSLRRTQSAASAAPPAYAFTSSRRAALLATEGTGTTKLSARYSSVLGDGRYAQGAVKSRLPSVGVAEALAGATYRGTLRAPGQVQGEGDIELDPVQFERGLQGAVSLAPARRHVPAPVPASFIGDGRPDAPLDNSNAVAQQSVETLAAATQPNFSAFHHLDATARAAARVGSAASFAVNRHRGKATNFERPGTAPQPLTRREGLRMTAEADAKLLSMAPIYAAYPDTEAHHMREEAQIIASRTRVEVDATTGATVVKRLVPDLTSTALYEAAGRAQSATVAEVSSVMGLPAAEGGEKEEQAAVTATPRARALSAKPGGLLAAARAGYTTTPPPPTR